MKTKLIGWIVGMILERVSEEMIEAWVEKGLDLLETAVLKSPNVWDDMAVLPMIKLAREVFDLDVDGDEEV